MRKGVVVLVVTVLASTSSAQAPAVPSCTYDECALRLEGARVVSGISGLQVSRVGMFGARGLDSLMRRSDSATVYARRFSTRQGRATVLGLVSAAAAFGYITAVGHAVEWGDSRAVSPEVYGVASIAFALIGAFEQSRARTALSRALWWHNRELQR